MKFFVLIVTLLAFAPSLVFGQSQPAATGAPRKLPGPSISSDVEMPKIEAVPAAPSNDLDYMGFSPSIDGQRCLASFKATMNDPGSLEIAGTFNLNNLASRMMSGGTIWPGYPEVIVYSIPVRGRNGFGGLVLRDLWCMFGRTPDAKLILLSFQAH